MLSHCAMKPRCPGYPCSSLESNLNQTESFGGQASHFTNAADALIITFLKHDSKIIQKVNLVMAEISTALVPCYISLVQFSFVPEFLRICAAVHYY